MIKLPKFFRSKTQEPDPSKEDTVEVNLMEEGSEDEVNEGQVTIHFDSISPINGALLVGFFVSNGLSRKVKFEKVPLLLVDSDKRVLARQSFDGEIIGEIGSGSSKACVVRFLPDNVYVKDVPRECKVCFDLPIKQPHNTKIEYQALPKSTTENQRKELERILTELPSTKHGEVSFSPLQARITTEKDLLTTVIIRNSRNKEFSLEQIHLAVFDAHHEELVRGKFEIKGLTIEPFKAMLWTFNFGHVSRDQKFDLSKKWSLNVVQNEQS